MTKVFNDPAEFAEDQLTGFLDLYADRLRGVPGGVVARRNRAQTEPQVAVVVGGGSGHYPAFAGIVGPGFATGAVVGNIFTSPSAAQVYSVAKAANQGRGVVLSFGNYAGDNMNFGIAAQRLRKEGIDTRIVVVTDDVASATDPDQRRGIAGDFTVFKVLGAAAAAGADLDSVEAAGRAANDATRSLGVAFSGCTMPGADRPLFSVPEGKLGLGLGIHGEPGIRDEPLPPADNLAETLVSGVLDEAPAAAGNRVAVILNGLGTSKYEELFLLWGPIAARLRAAGLEPVDVEVGELVTSLDMGGLSLTLMWLDESLETHWRADAYTPGYRKAGAPIEALLPASADEDAEQDLAESVPDATDAARELSDTVLSGLRTMAGTLHEHEGRLGEIDAVAGDGDHGRGMVKGIDAAVSTVERLLAGGGDTPGVDPATPGAGWLLRQAGQAWAAQAGGTSGVLWGAALEAAGSSLTDERQQYGPAEAADAVRAFADAIVELGGAAIGDKTLVDSLLPFAEELATGIDAGSGLAASWDAAARAATGAAEATAPMTPKRGRARPLAEKSIGTADAGATSFALIVTALGRTQ